MSKRLLVATMVPALLSLTACTDGAVEAVAPDTKATDAWCADATSAHIKSRGPLKGQPSFVEVRDHKLVKSTKNSRVCSYVGVVKESEEPTEVQTWTVSFSSTDGGWGVRREDAGEPETVPAVEVDANEVGAQGAASSVVAALFETTIRPRSVEVMRKASVTKRALGEDHELKAYRFDSETDFEVCVVHTKSGAWARATAKTITSGPEGADC